MVLCCVAYYTPNGRCACSYRFRTFTAGFVLTPGWLPGPIFGLRRQLPKSHSTRGRGSHFRHHKPHYTGNKPPRTALRIKTYWFLVCETTISGCCFYISTRYLEAVILDTGFRHFWALNVLAVNPTPHQHHLKGPKPH
jgi:hypothetical protein